jgi:hypothetical protein
VHLKEGFVGWARCPQRAHIYHVSRLLRPIIALERNVFSEARLRIEVLENGITFAGLLLQLSAKDVRTFSKSADALESPLGFSRIPSKTASPHERIEHRP